MLMLVGVVQGEVWVFAHVLLPGGIMAVFLEVVVSRMPLTLMSDRVFVLCVVCDGLMLRDRGLILWHRVHVRVGMVRVAAHCGLRLS